MLQARFRQAMNDPSCKAIVFDVDSPGGSVDLVPEMASEIFEGRKRKTSVAVVNSLCCSAAYWLSSAASEIVCTNSGQAGGIGVYLIHEDDSGALEKAGVKMTVIRSGRYKAEGNPTEPLSPDARDYFQSQVDDLSSPLRAAGRPPPGRYAKGGARGIWRGAQRNGE